MLKGALGQLFDNLNKVAASERSDYENALHTQLLAIARLLIKQSDHEAVEGTLEAFDGTLETVVNLETRVDLAPGPSDVKRIKCPYNKCPIKVQ